jgi:hypothetical protein
MPEVKAHWSTTFSFPQSQRQFQRLFFLRRSASDKTVSSPYFFPVRSIELRFGEYFFFLLRKHPQLRVFVLTRFCLRTITSRPQSQRHNHVFSVPRAETFDPASQIAVSRPNLCPGRMVFFALLHPQL